MYILNGRVKGDYSGKATCKNAGSVNYFIWTPDVLKRVICLNVLDISPLLSDVHCPIELVLDFNVENPNMLIHERTKRKLWDRNKVQEFANNIDMTIVNKIYYELCSMEDSSNYTVDSVNTLVEEICNLYSSSCTKCFGEAKQTNPVTCNVKRNLSWLHNFKRKMAKTRLHMIYTYDFYFI